MYCLVPEKPLRLVYGTFYLAIGYTFTSSSKCFRKQDAINEGMTTLIQEGIRLVFDGKTDFNQVMSVCAL